MTIKLKNCIHIYQFKIELTCMFPCTTKITCIWSRTRWSGQMSPQFSILLRLNMHLANVFTVSWLLVHLYITNGYVLIYWETLFLPFFFIPDPKCCPESVIMFCSNGKVLSYVGKGENFRRGTENVSVWFAINLGPWKCNASSVIIVPVAGLIITADSQAMQQELDILNGPDITVLTFYFYILSKKGNDEWDFLMV